MAQGDKHCSNTGSPGSQFEFSDCSHDLLPLLIDGDRPFMSGASMNVLRYIVSEWLPKQMVVSKEKMELTVREYATTGRRPRLIFGPQIPQLYCRELESIGGHLYSLELEKVPSVYWLKSFTATRRILGAAQQSSDISEAVAIEKIISYPSGFYKCKIVTTSDHQYMSSLSLTRL